MFDLPTLPFIEAGAADPQSLLVDPACTGQGCFSVVDTYGPDQTGTQGFTVYDPYHYNLPTATAEHTQGLYVDDRCAGTDCFSVNNTFDGNPNNPNGLEGFSVFDYSAPNYSGPPQEYMPSPALAPPLAPGAPTEEAVEAKMTGEEGKSGNANPSHLLLCGHAMLLGALNATVTKLSKGGSWSAEFERESKQAAAAVTPVGGYVLSTHVFGK